MPNLKDVNPHLISLEPRMMFDGAGLVTAVTVDVALAAPLTGNFDFSTVQVSSVGMDLRSDVRRSDFPPQCTLRTRLFPPVISRRKTMWLA